MDSTLSLIILLALTAAESCLMYVYLHRKTRISLSYLYKDNLLVIACAGAAAYFAHGAWGFVPAGFLALFAVPAIGLIFTMIRFFRFPLRKVSAEPGAYVSPADGNIIYIKKIESGEVPLAVKNGVEASLTEFANTGLIECPRIMVGINMTPFDVHRNCAPCEGKVLLNKHFDGEFLSLKDPRAFARNERNSIVIETPDGEKVGVVQTASKLVRRIVTYKREGDPVSRGEWIGMIRFGSQVDLILPADAEIDVKLGQQVYCKKTVIAHNPKA